MIYLLIILGMLAAFWSGFFMCNYKQKEEFPTIELPFLKDISGYIKPEKEKPLTKEEKKTNIFFD